MWVNQGVEQIHNFSFSGGSEKTSYRTSISYTNQNGILVGANDSYRRYSFNSSLTTKLTTDLTATVNIQYNNKAKTSPKNFESIFYNAITFGPYAATGYGILPGTEEKLPYSSPDNIVAIETPTQNNDDLLRLFGKLEYSPIKNLKLTGEYTFTRTAGTEVNIFSTNEYVNPLTYQLDVINPTSSYKKYASVTNNNALNLYATYHASIASAHNFTLLLGTNQEQSKQSGLSVNRLDLISSEVPSVSTSTGTTTGTDDFGEYAVSGYFGRFNYNYKNRYLFEATSRYDGSSRFPAGHRFGFFPAFSAGWNLMQESFMAGLKNTFQEIKLRGSYGEIGNQVITFSDGSQNYYPATPGLAAVKAPWINPATNIVYTSLATPTLVSSSFSWERVRTTNLGIDLGLLNNRLSGSFDLFRRQTLDMLAPGSQLPVTLGAEAPLQNAADLQVNGWELQLSWKDKVGKLSYYVNFNLSDNHARITRFENPGGLLSQYYVGQQLNEIWGYVTQGYFSTADFEPGSLDDNLMNGKLLTGIAPFQGVLQNPGDIRFEDLNDDGVINTGSNTLSDPGDRKVIGNSTRRLQYGFSGGLSVGPVDFSFFLQGIGKRDVWISNQVFWPYLDQFAGIFEHQLDYWTPSNTDGYYPRMYSNASGNTGTSRNVQTKYLTNGAYMRIKNIQIGYSLPKTWMQKLTVSSARVFFSGENLFTFDHLPDGMDPESTNLGTGGIYPFLKKYSFGININF